MSDETYAPAERRLRTLLHEETGEDRAAAARTADIVRTGVRLGRARRLRRRLAAGTAVLLLVAAVPVAWSHWVVAAERPRTPPAGPPAQPVLTSAGSLPVRAQVAAASSNLLALADSDNGDRVEIWRVAGSAHDRRVASFSVGRNRLVTSMAVDRSGSLLALGVSPDRRFTVDSRPVTPGLDGNATIELWTLRASAAPRKVSAIPALATSILSMRMSPDGALLVTVEGDTARLWRLDHGRATELTSLQMGDRGGSVQIAALSPDRHRLAVAAFPDGPGPCTLTLWDITDPTKPIRHGSLPLTENGRTIGFSSDGRSVLVGNDVLSLQDFDTQPRARLGILYAGGNAVAAADPSAPFAAVLLPFGSLTLVDIRNPLKPQVVSRLPSPPGPVVFSADGRWLAVVTETEVQLVRLR